MLEGAAYVRLHVTLFSAGGHPSRRGCPSFWLGQYDEGRFTEPLTETHAAARAAAIRRHHHHHGDDLGDGPLGRSGRWAARKGLRRHFIGAARIYSTFSFFFLVFFFVAAE